MTRSLAQASSGTSERRALRPPNAEASECAFPPARALTQRLRQPATFPRTRKRLANFFLSRAHHSQGLGVFVVILSEECGGNEKGADYNAPMSASSSEPP